MKFKLKDIDFNNMEYVYNINTNNGLGNSKLISSKLINLTYMKDELEFQTPKVIIKKIQDNPNFKTIIYSVFMNSCLLLLKQILEKIDIYMRK